MYNLESERASAVARFVYPMFATSRYREVEEKGSERGMDLGKRSEMNHCVFLLI